MPNLILAETGTLRKLNTKYIFFLITSDLEDEILNFFNIPESDQILLCANGVPFKKDVANSGNIYVFDRRVLLSANGIQDFTPIHDTLHFPIKEFSCDLELFQDHLKLALEIQSKSREMLNLVASISTGILYYNW
jgi:hypothetical protein